MHFMLRCYDCKQSGNWLCYERGDMSLLINETWILVNKSAGKKLIVCEWYLKSKIVSR